MCIENWILNQLLCTERASISEQAHGLSTNERSPTLAVSMSGVEIGSPHPFRAAQKENTFEIPGIGIISTQWIGHEGREKLMEQFAMDIETPKLSALKKELRTLASVCLKAFESFEVVNISDPKVKQALDLCRSYVPKSSARHVDNPISRVWKETTSIPHQLPKDNIQLATQVLGENIVDMITEKRREPPDVRNLNAM